MCKTELTEFGKEVKFELVLRNKTQEWLMEQVRADTGLYLDSPYLRRIMIGKATPAKIIASIRKILDLADSD
ncbi:XRE family transcriptional regulator [Anaerotruncus sp. AF02-27]|uniref:XRE family transcriptional regulator n=1 Tax=Anaerotruncus TaxID=244127 RepID=UPI000E512FE8|nr:XRE family transcriptional regulator [Anaerotruncus sp. AF02-27]RGX55324.1 XRE family transcriptional regulator [Anaerotruncus sp. AF02-27]